MVRISALATLGLVLVASSADAQDPGAAGGSFELILPDLVDRGSFSGLVVERTPAGQAPVEAGSQLVFRGHVVEVEDGGRVELPAFENAVGNVFVTARLLRPDQAATSLAQAPELTRHVEVVPIPPGLPVRVAHASDVVSPGGTVRVEGQGLDRLATAELADEDGARYPLAGPVGSSLQTIWTAPAALPAGTFRLVAHDVAGGRHEAPNASRNPTVAITGTAVTHVGEPGRITIRSDADIAVRLTGGEPQISLERTFVRVTGGQPAEVSFRSNQVGAYNVAYEVWSQEQLPEDPDAPKAGVEAEPLEARYDPAARRTQVLSGFRLTGSDGQPLVSTPVDLLLAHPGGLDYRRSVSDSEGRVHAAWTLSGSSGPEALSAHLFRVLGHRWKEPIPCRCELASHWDPAEPIRAGLLSPRGAFRLPWAKALPLHARAYDVDVLEATCTLRDPSEPRCSSMVRLRLPARPLYEWTVIELVRWDGSTWVSWPDGLPRGGFKARRSAAWSDRATGEQVRYYPPLLEKLGDRARVKLEVEVRDDAAYNAPKPADPAVSFEVWIVMGRASRNELEMTVVEAPEAPRAPDLRPEIASVDCPCGLTYRWENPSPISATAQALGPPKSLTRERLTLTGEASDSDRLVLWCEGRGCESSVEELQLTDVPGYHWTASGGTFLGGPEGQRGSSAIYETPEGPGDVAVTLTVTDSGAQFADDPVPRPLELPVVQGAVLLVPGIMGTELIHHSTEVWPPTWSPTYTNIRDVIGYVGDPTAKPGFLIAANYGSVQADLESHGYGVQPVPYDWRLENQSHMRLYHTNVDIALQNRGADRIDIVSHSMGGLITREWLRSDAGAADLAGHVFFAGTPHHGAPRAYLTLKQTGRLAPLADDMLRGLPTLPGAALGALWSGFIEALHANVLTWPSVYQLLPAPSWFALAEGVVYKQGIGYLPNWPRTYKIDPDARIPTTQPFLIDNAEEFWRNLPDRLPAGVNSYAIVSHTLDTDFRYHVRDLTTEYALGDATVPAISGAWEGSAQRRIWDAEMAAGRPGIYYAPDAVHAVMLNHERIQDFISYVLESLR